MFSLWEQHSPATCRFKDFVCNLCKKTGHIVRACHSIQRAMNSQQTKGSEKDTHHVTVTDQEDTQDSYSLFNINGLGCQPFYVTLKVHGEPLQMELDTGAAVYRLTKQFGMLRRPLPCSQPKFSYICTRA